MKKVLLGVLFLQLFVLGACGTNGNSQSAAPSVSTISSEKNLIEPNSATIQSSINTIASTSVSTVPAIDMSNEALAVAAYLYSQTDNQSVEDLLDKILKEFDDPSSPERLQLSKTQWPDIIVSMSSMGSTEAYHFEDGKITGTAYSNAGDAQKRTYTLDHLFSMFGQYQTKLELIAEKASNQSPD